MQVVDRHSGKLAGRLQMPGLFGPLLLNDSKRLSVYFGETQNVGSKSKIDFGYEIMPGMT